MTKLSFLLPALLLGLSASAGELGNFVDGPEPFTDSGIVFPSYESIQYEFNLVARKYPFQAQVIHYGKSVGGRDLTMMRLESRNASRPYGTRPAIEISGTIHGNEYLGIEDKLPRYLLDNQGNLPGFSTFLAAGGVIYVVPVVNPDGFADRIRANSNGADLNRDFDVVPLGQNKLKEPETKALAQYILSDVMSNQLNLVFAVDYHCCVPALLTPWTYKNAYPTQTDLVRFNEISDFQRQTIGFKVGNGLDTVGYLAHGTSTDYFYGKYGTAAFTIEGSHGGETKRFAQHVRFLDTVMDRIIR